MAKSKDVKVEEISPFVGGEEDDLSDMQYVQDEKSISKVETHPPETEEEAELMAIPEDEEEPEAEAEEEEATSQKIPKERFDEVNERMKRAEERLRELEERERRKKEEAEAEPEPEPFDFEASDKAAMDAMLEGDEEKFKSIQKEQRAAMREEMLREARKLAATGDQKTIEDQKFEQAGAEIEGRFPQFDADSESFNQEARDELIDLYAGYVNSGRYSRVEALRHAAEKTARLYGLDKPPAADEGNVVPMKKKPVDVKKKTKMAEEQPPALTGHGEGREEPKVDVTRMSEEAWEKLPESTKRRLRGDII